MECVWCDNPIRKGEQVSLNAQTMANGLWYCTSNCMDNHTRYCASTGEKMKPKTQK